MVMFSRLCAALAVLALSSPVQASTISVSFESVRSNNWVAEFTVKNDGSLPEVGSFTVYFDYSRVDGLNVVSSPVAWESLVWAADAALTSDGAFDALVLEPAGALKPGESLGGFKVQFDWAGMSAPASLAYTINDPVSFAVLERGYTVPAAGPAVVPEPATALMLLSGVAAVAAVRTRRGSWLAS